MKSLKIVPVAISYENDPCDTAKAIELFEKDVNGSYERVSLKISKVSFKASSVIKDAFTLASVRLSTKILIPLKRLLKRSIVRSTITTNCSQ